MRNAWHVGGAQVWDSRNGQLLRVQQGHKGMVTCVNFSNIIRLLFSGSIDNTVGIWTEKGVNLQVRNPALGHHTGMPLVPSSPHRMPKLLHHLQHCACCNVISSHMVAYDSCQHVCCAPQMVSVGGPVFSLAWDDRRRFLIVGGHSVINIYKVGCLVPSSSGLADQYMRRGHGTLCTEASTEHPVRHLLGACQHPGPRCHIHPPCLPAAAPPRTPAGGHGGGAQDEPAAAQCDQRHQGQHGGAGRE